MNIAADELLQELVRIDDTLDEAVRRAGQGCAPDFERRLGAHLRSLRNMLGPDDAEVAADAMEANTQNAADAVRSEGEQQADQVRNSADADGNSAN